MVDRLELLDMSVTKESYDLEPVFYCADCLSLRVLSIGNIDYCDECGSTEIAQTDIHSWEALYKEKYNKDFLTTKKHGRE